jgi:hypothetical protein
LTYGLLLFVEKLKTSEKEVTNEKLRWELVKAQQQIKK